jgi:long-chain acyl-CoA synthetase
MGNLARLLTDAAARYAARPALIHEGARIDYAELDGRAARFAGLFRSRGVGPGDRVALLIPNEPAYIAAFYGALRLGAIVVPLNPLLKSGEIEQRLDDSGAAVLVDSSLVDAAAAAAPVAGVADRDPGDTAVLLYTSGTTGKAKGAELTHAGLRAAAEFLARPLLGLTEEDVVLGAAPLTHVFGLSGVMNPALVAGACVALMPRFDADSALELMRRERAGVFLGVPSMCIMLLRAAESADDVPGLRVAHVGGSPLAPETLEAFASRFGCPVLEGYGMTETGGGVVSHVLGQRCKPGSVGTRAPRVELRIDVIEGEVGEVLLRGPSLFRGYWNSPEATGEALDADGWFRTGDVGYLDEDGYLFLVDRMKDVILRGGYTVYPREIEDLLYEHPSVSEATVVGVPDETLGEEVVALVVPRAGGCDPEDVKAFVRERIAAYKYPRLVVVTDELPRTPSGKILKREIDRRPLRRALDMEVHGD